MRGMRRSAWLFVGIGPAETAGNGDGIITTTEIENYDEL